MSNLYLERYAEPNVRIATPPSKDLGLTIVIPAYNETSLLPTFESLKNTHAPLSDAEIIVVFNCSENNNNAKEVNTLARQELEIWLQQSFPYPVHIITENQLPKKQAGVGLARKIGMDEAYRRYFEIDKLTEGIIVCFDADSQCQSNYLIAIEQHFRKAKKATAVGIHFEHPLEGHEFPSAVYKGIYLYELHLRYYIDFLRWAGHPHSRQTIGSSMAVTAQIYGELGGMNKRKAGEDFYFLQKFIQRDLFNEIKTTTVIPSPRMSDRVPFGTGKAVADYQTVGEQLSYNPQSFLDLKVFLDLLPQIFDSKTQQIDTLPESIAHFLRTIDFETNLKSIVKQSPTFPVFKNRFFSWFNAFTAMKYMHFCRDHYYPDIATEQAAFAFLEHLKLPTPVSTEGQNLLKRYREIHLKGII